MNYIIARDKRSVILHNTYDHMIKHKHILEVKGCLRIHVMLILYIEHRSL